MMDKNIIPDKKTTKIFEEKKKKKKKKKKTTKKKKLQKKKKKKKRDENKKMEATSGKADFKISFISHFYILLSKTGYGLLQ